ncbi:MAG: DUF2079 domain-containing protein [Thermoleophilia bacterium]|nr:DUF2079 domain-containing protein [Thermoleophilia bacterium]
MLRHRAFSTGRFDLGNMVQAVWSTTEGRPLEVTGARGEQFVRLGAHVDPLLVLFAPLWALWPEPSLLLVVQASALALGAVAVYLLAMRHLRSEAAALAFALAYLLSPALGWMALADLHAVAFATPLLAFAFWALDDDRLLVFAVLAALAAASKEHVALAIAGLGLWYALARGRTLAGAAIAAVSLAWTAVAVGVVAPHFSPTGSLRHEPRYAEVGGSPVGIVKTALTEPWRVAAEAFDERGLEYLLALLVPLAALPLLAPLLTLAAVPEVGLNLLSARETQTSIRYHYEAVSLGVLFPAAVLGTARLARGRPAIAVRAGVVVLVLSLGSAYRLGPLPVWRALPGGDGLRLSAIRPDSHDAVVRRALAQVPEGVPASAVNSVGAHLSARRRIHVFPTVAEARWVVVDRKEPGWMERPDRVRLRIALAALRESPPWRIVFAEDGVVVFRREAASATR